MDVYTATFAVLVVGSAALIYLQYREDPTVHHSADSDTETVDANAKAARFKKIFLPVYLLVYASDWLQGPYVYTLYKDEYHLSEPTVAALFAAGFISAGLSGFVVGSVADKYGRRLACQMFCLTYILSCLTKLFPDVIMLLVGRLLGGLSTTLMYSVFESWMVTEYLAQGLDKSDMSLGSLFGLMTTLNSIVAIIAGVVGESFVSMTGTKTSPFMVAIVCLVLASWLMHRNWNENYGDSGSKSPDATEKSGMKSVIKDKRILVLAFIACVFEGSMYLFVFFWSAALKSAHEYSLPEGAKNADGSQIPFGVIFSTFMAAMMLGSIAFSHATAMAASPLKTLSWLRSMFKPAQLLTIAIAGAATALLLTVLIKRETLTFWCFCAFEACIGIYFPSIANQRGRIVDDGVRAKVYGLLRIPLNAFVVIMLFLTQEGDAHRDKVFVFCGGLLLLATIAAAYTLDDKTEESEGYIRAENSGDDVESAPSRGVEAGQSRQD